MTERKNAHQILKEASDLIHERGAMRDKPNGERSMSKAVAAFWSLFGDEINDDTPMEERHGWAFMQCLKLARGWTNDDMLDEIAYGALKAENVIAEEAAFAELMRRANEVESGVNVSAAELDWWDNNRGRDWPVEFRRPWDEDRDARMRGYLQESSGVEYPQSRFDKA